jgi:FxsC-like protein
MTPIKNYLFFLSYARDDRGDHDESEIVRFYNDLEKYLRRRDPKREGPLGFFDTRSTTTGDFWTPAADHALRTCKVFVTVYSPTYFTRDYCGQEWEIFQRRLEQFRNTPAGKDSPSLIMPVLFVGLPLLKETIENMAGHVNDIVYRNHADPEKYVEGGLEVFMLGKYNDDYQEFVGRFATRLFELSKTHSLPEGSHLPSVSEVSSAFLKPKKKGRQTPTKPKTPDFVEFLFLAGSREQMEEVRESVESYGDGGRDWKAYEPLFDDKIGVLAQTIANREKLMSSIVKVEKNLTDWLQETKENNHIAAIVADSWTLRAKEYADLAADYDAYDSVHTLMLVCMNADDKETQKRSDELKERVAKILQTKVARGFNSNFLFPVSSSEEFEQNLSTSLSRIKMELLNSGLNKMLTDKSKRAGKKSEEPAQPLPSIPGPGGA